MTGRTTHARIVGGLAALVFGATACGQAGGSTPGGTTSTSPVDEYESPIATFLGVDFSGGVQQDTYLVNERTRIEWVSTCMAKAGFEYRAADPAQWIDSWQGDPADPAWGSPEWTAIYGFGVSTQMFDQAVVGAELVGYTSNQGGEYVEPNAEYISTLSSDEEAAYWTVLYGNDGYEWDDSMSDAENQAAMDEYFETLVPSGCEQRSYEQVSSSDPYAQLYESFGDELSSMYERAQSDPAIITALASISRCATDAGFNFTDEESANEEIQQRLEPVQAMLEWPVEQMTDEALTEEALSNLSDADGQVPAQQVAMMSAEGKAILAEVQQYEIDMATAVQNCGYGDITRLYQDVMGRFEQQFIDAHRAELESMRTN